MEWLYYISGTHYAQHQGLVIGATVVNNSSFLGYVNVITVTIVYFLNTIFL
jgi:hypothetical protein